MELAHGIRRQLGTIMVEEGFLTEPQLKQALKVQHRTSQPLGQVLIELGWVSAGAVANALAEQHGGLLNTEYGVGVGPFWAAASERESQWHASNLDRQRLVEELDALRERCEVLSRGVAFLESELQRVRDSV